MYIDDLQDLRLRDRIMITQIWTFAIVALVFLYNLYMMRMKQLEKLKFIELFYGYDRQACSAQGHILSKIQLELQSFWDL